MGWAEPGRRSRHAGLRDRGLATGRDRRAAELAQPLLKLAVSVLQFLVLAGELPQLVLEPLDPHIRVGIVGLRLALRGALRGTSHGNEICAEAVCEDKESIAAIATALVALRNLNDILP